MEEIIFAIAIWKKVWNVYKYWWLISVVIDSFGNIENV